MSLLRGSLYNPFRHFTKICHILSKRDGDGGCHGLEALAIFFIFLLRGYGGSTN